MITDDIQKNLFDLQDLKYRDMQIKIIPSVEADSVIGRLPVLGTFQMSLSDIC